MAYIIYSEVVLTDPSREQLFLSKLDRLAPVDAHESFVHYALDSWLERFCDDGTTLEDLHYAEYAERSAEDIGPVELVLHNPDSWDILCTRTNGQVKFYYWQRCLLWFVGYDWTQILRSLLWIWNDNIKEEDFEGEIIRKIPLKYGLSPRWTVEEGLSPWWSEEWNGERAPLKRSCEDQDSLCEPTTKRLKVM